MKRPETRTCNNCGMVYQTRYHPGLIGLLFLIGLVMIGYAFVGLLFWSAALLYWARRQTRCIRCGAKDGAKQGTPIFPQSLEPQKYGI
jgi:hypothetical protein